MEQNLVKLFKCINRLKDTDKNKINEISILAEGFKNNEKFSQQISEKIMDQIKIAENNAKLSLFYAMDSIVKNICEPYNKYFSESLVETFVDTFKSCKDSNTRVKLYKLRATWKDKHFPYETTNDLDKRIRVVDPNWPLIERRVTELESNVNRKRKSESSISQEENELPKCKLLKTETKENEEIKTEDAFKIWSSDEIINKLGNVNDLKNILANINNLQKENSNSNINDDTQNQIEQIDSPIKVYQEYSSVNQAPPCISNQAPIIPFNTGLPAIAPMNPLNMNNGICNQQRKYPQIWSNTIHGFPQMPLIGTDPRFLYKCPFPDNSRTVTINNETFHVVLDRIQPLVFEEGFYRALRFACTFVKVWIDGNLFELSTNDVNFVTIKMKSVALCVGGPFHEIIIDGWPYHVPMNGQVYTIMMGNIPVDISFKVKKTFRLKTMNPIPKFIFNWVEMECFGHPKSLSIPPMNPLNHPMLQDPLSIRYRNENNTLMNHLPHNPLYTGYPIFNAPPQAQFPNNMMPFNPMHVINAPVTSVTPPVVRPLTVTPPLLINTQQNIIIPKPEPVEHFYNQLHSSVFQLKTNDVPQILDLDFTRYSYEIFKKFNQRTLKEIQSGTQCDICGMRIANEDTLQFKRHMDYHCLLNSGNLPPTCKQRSFSKISKSWVSPDLPKQEFQEKQNTKEQERKYLRCDDYQEHEKCMVCDEKFEVRWMKSEDEYCYLDAVIVDDKAYHPICTSDIGKTFQFNDTVKDLLENFDPHSILENLLKRNFQNNSDAVYNGV